MYIKRGGGKRGGIDSISKQSEHKLVLSLPSSPSSSPSVLPRPSFSFILLYDTSASCPSTKRVSTTRTGVFPLRLVNTRLITAQEAMVSYKNRREERSRREAKEREEEGGNALYKQVDINIGRFLY